MEKKRGGGPKGAPPSRSSPSPPPNPIPAVPEPSNIPTPISLPRANAQDKEADEAGKGSNQAGPSDPADENWTQSKRKVCPFIEKHRPTLIREAPTIAYAASKRDGEPHGRRRKCRDPYREQIRGAGRTRGELYAAKRQRPSTLPTRTEEPVGDADTSSKRKASKREGEGK